MLSHIAIAQTQLTNDGVEVFISEGTKLYIKGNLANNDSTIYNLGSITIEGSIINNAFHLFTDKNHGNVILKGEQNQRINGTGGEVYFHVLKNQTSDTLILELPIHIYDSLSLEKGYILLNSNNITLDNYDLNANGFMYGETDSVKIIGDSGYIMVNYISFQPLNKNIAGIGLVMNSTNNFGNTTIKRFHQQQAITDGNINKIYAFDFANSTNSNIHITYLDSDFNKDSLLERDFTIWKSTDFGANYTDLNGNVDTTNNFVDVFGIDVNNAWLTIAPKNCRTVPSVNIGDDTTYICPGGSEILIAGNHSTNYNFYWLDGSIDSSFTPSQEGLVWVRVSTSKGCYTIDSTYIKFNAVPKADFSTTNICNKDSADFTNLSSITNGSIVKYNWNFGNGDSSNLENPKERYITTGSHDIHLSCKSDSGCVHDTTHSIAVYPLPQPNFHFTMTCGGNLLHYYDSTTIESPFAIISRFWDFGNGITSTTATDTVISYASAGQYISKIIAQSNAGCIDSISQSLFINNIDTASFTATDVCLGDSTEFSNTSTHSGSGYNFIYIYDDNDSSFTENPKHQFSTIGIHTTQLIIEYNSGLCRDSASTNHTVSSSPYINFGDTIESCDSYTLDAQNSGSSYLWNNGSTGQTQQITNTGTYTVSITNSNSCTFIDSIFVIIYQSPTPNLGSDTSVCTNYVLDAGYNGSAFLWNTGQSSQSIVVDSSGIYSVSITNNNNCTGSDTINITVLPQPVAQFSIDNACLNQESTFINNSSISSGSITGYIWDFGDGNSSILQNPSYTFANDTTYNIWLKISSNYGCKDSISQTTNIKPLPTIIFSSDYQCDKQEINFTNTSFIGLPYNINSYQWTFDDGNTSDIQTPTNHFYSAGNYNVKLKCITNSGCSDSLTKLISVDASDSVIFTSTYVCENDSTQFINNSTYIDTSLLWSWNFGDNSVSNNASVGHLYANAGNYNVTLIVNYKNGQCYDTIIQGTSVFSNPVINFGDTLETCGSSLMLDAQNSGCSYLWNDGSTNQQNTITIEGDYWVQITNSNSCSSTDSVYARLNTISMPNLGPDTSVCGQTVLNAGFVGSSFNWNTGDTSQSIYIDSSGLYIVYLTDKNGCLGYDSINIVVNPTPTAALSVLHPCANEPNYFQDESSIASGSIISYLYDFGDNSTSSAANTNHSYANAGNYQVTYTITSNLNCVSDTTIIHTVHMAPSAGFIDSSLCDNFEVSYNDTSTTSNAYTITTWQWSFQNGFSSTAQDTMVNYSTIGSYNTSLVVTTNVGCSDTASSSRNVVLNDSVYFFSSNTCIGDTSFFNNASTISGNPQWFWVFGNGDTSIVANPQYKYSNPGAYYVKLYVTYNNYCNSVYKDTTYIFDLPQINFSDTTKICGSSYTLDAQNPGSQYLWSDYSTNQTLTASTSGSYFVSIIDINSCQNSDTTLLNLIPLPQPNLGADSSYCDLHQLDAGLGISYIWNTGDTTQQLSVSQSGSYSVVVTSDDACIGSDTILLIINTSPTLNLGSDIDTCNAYNIPLSSNGFASYLWSTGDTTSYTSIDQSGTYWLRVTGQNKCSAYDSIDVNIQYLNIINISDTIFICSEDSVLVNPNIDDASINWSGPQGYNQTSDSIFISNAGTYYVEATVLTCIERDTFEAAISLKSMYPQFLSSSNVLTFDSVKFIELSHPDPIHFSWNFDDGTTDTIADPIHIFYMKGTYNVRLLAENSECYASISKPILVTEISKPRLNGGNPIEIRINKPEVPKFVEILNSNLYPNPNNGIFTLDVELSKESNIQIAVFDILGNIIYFKDYNNQAKIHELFNLNSLSNGYYFLSIRTINEMRTFKIGVVR